MKIKTMIILVFILAMGANYGEALTVSGGVWLVAENIVSNDALRMSLQEIEMLVKSGEKGKAIKHIEKIRKETKDNLPSMKDGENLPLILDVMELYYKGLSDVEEATTLLDKYRESAKGKRYTAYKQLYQMLRKRYSGLKDYKNAAEVAKEAALYDPKDYLLILPLIDLTKESPKECGELDSFIKEYTKSGGTKHEELLLAAILTSKDKPVTKMMRACEWLDNNRSGSEKMLSRALPLIATLIDAKYPQTAVEYYYALTNLAVRQPSNEERLTIFAMAINERQKLITALPDILPPSSNNK